MDAIVPAGSAVLYDYRCMHRGMPNQSADTERPILQFLYHKKSYVERDNYGQTSLAGSPSGS